MKLAFIIIPHEKASSYQIDKYTGQLGKKFNGCTYYEVKVLGIMYTTMLNILKEILLQKLK